MVNVGIMPVPEDTPAARANHAALAAVMPVRVVYASDLLPGGFPPDPDAIPWCPKDVPGAMPEARTKIIKRPGWHKAEVAFVQAWKRVRPEMPGDGFAWCVEHDVWCGDWPWLVDTANQCPVDLVGPYLRVFPSNKTMPGRMILCCFRASFRYMDALVQMASANRNLFCEYAVPGVAGAKGFSWKPWTSVPGLAGLHDRECLRARPPVAPRPGQKLWHPVK